jgi:hypothetical protein
MAERTSDFELVNSDDPVIHRHRNRGLWLIDRQWPPLSLAGATLTDVIALKKSVDELSKPPPAEPIKVAPPERHDFPRWIVPHSSHVTQLDHAPNIIVPGFKFDVNRDTGVVSVLVRNETEEARALAPKRKY